MPLSLVHDKSGFVTVVFMDLCLPLSPEEVTTAKELTTIEGMSTSSSQRQNALGCQLKCLCSGYTDPER